MHDKVPSEFRHVAFSILYFCPLSHSIPFNIGDGGQLIRPPCHDKEKIAEPIQITHHRWRNPFGRAERDAPPLGTPTHGTREMQAAGQRTTPGEHEATQRRKLFIPTVDVPFQRVNMPFIKGGSRRSRTCRRGQFGPQDE